MVPRLPELFNKDFLIGYVLPLLVFLVVSLQLTEAFGVSSQAAVVGFFRERESIADTFALLISLWLGGAILAAVNSFILRILEGYGTYHPLKLLKYNWIERRRYEQSKRQKASLDELFRQYRARNIDVPQSIQDQRMEAWRRLAERFPDQEDLLLPTSFGNTIRAFEVYSREMYGLDSIPGWYRLLGVIPSDYRELMDSAKANMDFWANSVFLSGILILEYIGLCLYTRSLPMWWFPIVALLVSHISYVGATRAAEEWGNFVKSAFDIFLSDLYEKLRIAPPETRDEERKLWTSFSQAMIYRLPSSLPALANSPNPQMAPPAGFTNEPPNAERALVSYQSLQRSFYVPDTKLYRETYPPDGTMPYSGLWPFLQAMAGTLDVAGIPGIADGFQRAVQDRLVGLERYWDKRASPPGYDSFVVPPLGQGGAKHYGDNARAGLHLLQCHCMRGEWDVLHRAEQVFDFVVSGWDHDPSHPSPGGLFCVQPARSGDRGTAANAPGALFALHLYQITGRQCYLEWAKKMYDWVNEYLRAPDGLYWDHIDLQGNIDTTQSSGNQGTMIGASVLLFQVTGDAAYLQQAEHIAGVTLNCRFSNQPAVSNAIFFKNLFLLEAVNHNGTYRHAMQTYADKMWDSVRDPMTSLFTFNGTMPVKLLDQAAMVQIYATLAYPAVGTLASQ